MTTAHRTDPDGFFSALFAGLGDAVYVIDPDTAAVVDVNEAGCVDLGMTREEVLEQSVLSLQKDVKGIPHWKQICRAIRESNPYVFVGRHQRKDGSEFPVEVHTTVLMHGGREYFVSAVRDISQRRQSELDLSQRDHIRDFVLNESSDGLWDWNVIGGQVYFSPQWKRMMGFGPGEVDPSIDTWVNMIHPEDMDGVMRALGAHLDGKTVRYEREYRLRNRNGDYLWVFDRGKVVERDARERPVRVVGMVHDITQRKQLEERLRDIASRDDLTGLPNRRSGYECLERQLSLADRKGMELSICLFDVDHFKTINDTWGHLAGDRVLRDFAELVRDRVRKSDVVCRWGGEEFLMLLPDTGGKDALTLANDLRRQVETVVGWDYGLKITVSGGVSSFPKDARTIEGLVKRADAALYRAKAAGRNQVLSARLDA